MEPVNVFISFTILMHSVIYISRLAELQLMCGSLITGLRGQQISNSKTNEEKIVQLQTLGQHADALGAQLAALERYVHYNKEGIFWCWGRG